MQKLGALLGKLAAKAGYDIKQDEFKAILEIDTEVPDTVAANLEKNLLTVASAASHPDVNKVLRQRILAPIDTRLDELITEMGLTMPAEYATEESSYKKLDIFQKTAAEHNKKSKPAAGDKDAAERERLLNEEVKKLKTEATNLTNTFAAKEKASAVDNELNYFALSKLNDFDLPEQMDLPLKLSIISGVVKKAFAKDGLLATHDDEGNLTITKKDGTPAFINNEPVVANTYLDGVYTQNKLLKVNDANNSSNSNDASHGARNVDKGQQNQSVENKAIAADLHQQAASLPA